MSEARIAAEADRAARAKPSASSRIGSIAFFVALWTGLVAAYALCVFGVAGREAMTSADPPFGIVPIFRFNTIYAALIAFMATALWIEHRAIPRDFTALRGLVAASDADWDRWRASLLEPSRSSVAAWLVSGAGVGQLVNFLGWKLGTVDAGVWPGHYVVMNVLATVLFAEMGVLGALSLRRSRVFLEMGRRRARPVVGARGPRALRANGTARFGLLVSRLFDRVAVDAGCGAHGGSSSA